jgi:hypothetical protein
MGLNRRFFIKWEPMSEQEPQRQDEPEEEEHPIPLDSRVWARYALGRPYKNDGLVGKPYPNGSGECLPPSGTVVRGDDRWAREILEVSPDASWPEIQASYRRLEERWERWHPDHPDDAARVHEILQVAYFAMAKYLSQFED